MYEKNLDLSHNHGIISISVFIFNSKSLKNFACGQMFRKFSVTVIIFEKISILYKFWKNFGKSRFWSKFSKNLDFSQNCWKMSILVKISKNLDFIKKKLVEIF